MLRCYTPIDIPATGEQPFTDYSRWRLRSSEDGRHTWHYLESDDDCNAWEQTDIDKYWLGIPLNPPALPPPKNALDAARNGYTFYKHLQAKDGHWPGEYGGPMFLMPGLVIGSYVTGMGFTEPERLEMIRYLLNRANSQDGGWGLHVEGQSTVFGTAMNYTVMRILGVSPDHPALVRARATLHKLGGATGVPSWGKFWLSVLNVYDWDGNNPIPPELWLLPDALPFHPHRWWIHTRNVYIPMAYLYAIRYKMEENDLIHSLRQELYTQDYHMIDWPAQRNNICKVDLYAPHTALFDFLYSILTAYEYCALPPLRKAGVDKCYRLIVQEDENTGYQTLGPVSKMMNLIVRYHVDGPDSTAYKLHRDKRADFMWIGPEGMRMCGTNGSQLWDIAFITQALVESGLAFEEENQESLIKALEWLDQCQIRDNPKHFQSGYRHPTKGAWPFSTKTQGYIVSDCTGEGLKAVLYLQKHIESTPKLVSERRLCDAVDLILGMQNADGGFASYELIRGPRWMEYLNPAEVFGAIMIEHSYPECTTSSITALSTFRKYYPHYRANDIQRVIDRAVRYVHDAQTPDGGWVGSWGICFTYAAMFACESLALVGETYATSSYAHKGCEFLLSHQREDGGWGESYKSCETSTWVEHEQTQVVQTCWATLALIYAHYPRAEPIERAVHLVMSRQKADGSWSQEAMEGIFNKSVTIAYPNFKFSFTIWMLGRAHRYLEELRKSRST
ncbi:terpene synthase [Laetiporus sulphureus 93-53]|uniref:Terpene cyclase/mutase family member n=1 Tax=Laetiporus sulphureus 93-53 TaxID=1314785 RepID=A0A165G705_9APHY|nr:terpene synthase [Laetiporus sulphureus 93-53]KZT09915.1 terpene synthase [Laetiporus sulphureus 93-53]